MRAGALTVNYHVVVSRCFIYSAVMIEINTKSSLSVVVSLVFFQRQKYLSLKFFHFFVQFLSRNLLIVTPYIDVVIFMVIFNSLFYLTHL